MSEADLGGIFRGFRPRLVPTLIAVPGVLLMLGLGSWQVQRLVEKNAENAFRAARVTAPAVDLPGRIDDLAEFEFRRVRVTGVLRHDREIFLNARSRRGNAGYHILSPLVRDGAAPVLVNRGWVPYERRKPETRAAGQVEGQVTIEGIARREARKGWFMPDNDPTRNEWFWYDLPAMAAAAGLSDIVPLYIEADASPNPGGFPIGGQTIVEIPSPHLQYAITWYALAIALGVIYFVWHLRRGS